MLRVTVLVILAKLVAGVFDPELHDKYLQLSEDEFIEYFNSQGYTWNITKYDDTIKRHHGALFDFGGLEDYPVQSLHPDLLKELPQNFDSRQKWPNCESIKKVNDQGNCGSCWTFGTADTASDRTCIHKGLHVQLSEQDFECLQKKVCDGGDPAQAFDYWKNKGLVSKDCKPYNIPKLKKNQCVKKCVSNSIKYANDKHHAEKIYRVSSASVDTIKAELFHFGPIQAAFIVYQDFMHYTGGIYEHKYGDQEGGHSVRLIGYGVENNVEYWLVANSWGPGWGENGLFRVKMLQEDIKFEDYLFSGMPKN